MRADVPVPIWPLFAMLAVALSVVVLAFAAKGDADVAPPTVETSLQAACAVAGDLGGASKLSIVQCRRAADPHVEGNLVIETVRVKDAAGQKFTLMVYMRQSAWDNTAFVQIG